MKVIFSFLFSCVLLASAMQAAGQPAFIKDSIDSYVEKGLRDWKVPGLSVVIVKDGKVVFIKGYGVRDITSEKKVDEETLFMIASNTKLFTASSLAMLESAGKLSLDDKITKYFPSYRLYDTMSTALVSIRDLLSHHIGTKTFQGDFTFWNTGLSREEIMRRMRLLNPPFHFRQEFGYCNSCFLTAGQVIPLVTGGRTWEDFVNATFIQPLEMTHTRVLSTGIASQENVASPYTNAYSGKLVKVPFDNWNNLAPAASIVSNVKDLSHWLLMQLDSGKYQGREIISWEALQKTRIANTWVRSIHSEKYPINYMGYGLGLFLGDYAGRQIYWHTGGAGGMVSNVCFVPEEKLGIAILTNNDNQRFFEDLRYQILDAYLGMPYVYRSEQDLPEAKEYDEQQLAEIQSWQKRLHGKERPVLKSYTGQYKNTLYGNIRITQESDHLLVHFETKPDLTATLEYMDNGEWLMTYNNILYGIFDVRFSMSGSTVQSLTTQQNPFVEYDPYTFTKISDH